MALNISKLNINQEKMDKLIKLDLEVKKLKGSKQGFSIHKFISIFSKKIIYNFFIFHFIALSIFTKIFLGDDFTFITHLLTFMFIASMLIIFIFSFQETYYPKDNRIDSNLLKLKFDANDNFIQSIIEHHTTNSGFIIPQFNSNLQAIKTRYNK